MALRVWPQCYSGQRGRVSPLLIPVGAGDLTPEQCAGPGFRVVWCYGEHLPRGKRLWCRVKDGDRWLSRPTPYGVGDEIKALRYADAAQRRIDERAARPSGPMTVRWWADRWVEQRRAAD